MQTTPLDDSGITIQIGDVVLSVKQGFDPSGVGGCSACSDGGMLIGHPRQRVYLAVGATDLRKAVDGLARHRAVRL